MIHKISSKLNNIADSYPKMNVTESYNEVRCICEIFASADVKCIDQLTSIKGKQFLIAFKEHKFVDALWFC
jgi:hypothetical protein